MTALEPRNELFKSRVQKYHRLKCAIDLEVSSDLVFERCRSHNLSASGMFVDAALDYRRDMVVSLRFVLDHVTFETRAKVIHVRPAVGFGVEFLDLTADQHAQLLRYVHRERATREAERLLHHIS